MKNLQVAILISIYLSASIGATVHLHYCMGRLVDWSLFLDKSATCGKCGMSRGEAKDKGCCKDEHKKLKIEIDQKMVKTATGMIPWLEVDIPCYCIEYPYNPAFSERYANPISHAPPRESGIALYIRNCVFLI